MKRKRKPSRGSVCLVLQLEKRTITEGPKEGKRKRKHSRATNTISGVEAEKRKH